MPPSGCTVQQSGHRLPEVLVVGESVQARAQRVGPVEFELVGQAVAVRLVRVSMAPPSQRYRTVSVLKVRHDVSMAETTSRVLQLLGLLQARRVWTGDELADRLGVTARCVRRDVDRLRELGYPVHASKGHGGGYQLGRRGGVAAAAARSRRGGRDGGLPAAGRRRQRRRCRRVGAARAEQAGPGDAGAVAFAGVGGPRGDGDADVGHLGHPGGTRRADDARAGVPRPRARHRRLRRPGGQPPPRVGSSPTNW